MFIPEGVEICNPVPVFAGILKETGTAPFPSDVSVPHVPESPERIRGALLPGDLSVP